MLQGLFAKEGSVTLIWNLPPSDLKQTFSTPKPWVESEKSASNHKRKLSFRVAQREETQLGTWVNSDSVYI